jgi:hypothetical protein
MGGDYTGTMGDSAFDHDVTRIVTGDAESLRARLAGALEQMGYRVLNENPIQARRGASSLARAGCSQDVLDYRRTLDIGLKSAGTNATRVTFAYTVTGVHTGYLTKGDRNTLTREAEAVIAMARSRAALSYCLACGADGAGGMRFCRQCGAPVAASDPPELDLLRLTAAANAGYKNIGGGFLFIALGTLIPLMIYLFKHDTMSAEKMLKLTFYLSIISGIGLGLLIAGIGRLRKIIERKTEPQEAPSPSRRDIAPPDKAALPPQSIQHPVQHSVTEATTGLLPQEVKRTNDLN